MTLRSSDTNEITRKLVTNGLGDEANKRADPVFLLRQKERTCDIEPWCFVQVDGAITRSQVPGDWTHWKNVYLWHPLPFYNREALEEGRAIASWPLKADQTESKNYSYYDYVGLYVLRPARKWRALVERIGLDDEIYQTDQLASWLEDNIAEIITVAEEPDDSGSAIEVS